MLIYMGGAARLGGVDPPPLYIRIRIPNSPTCVQRIYLQLLRTKLNPINNGDGEVKKKTYCCAKSAS